MRGPPKEKSFPTFVRQNSILLFSIVYTSRFSTYYYYAAAAANTNCTLKVGPKPNPRSYSSGRLENAARYSTQQKNV